MNICLTPRQILVALLSIIGVLLLANAVVIVMQFGFDHAYGRIFGLASLFHFDREQTISAFFSAVQLLIAALTLWVVGAKSRSLGLKYIYWHALALIFLFLAIDEFTSIHERLVEPLRERFELSGLLFFGWVIPYGIAVVLLAIVFSRFVFSLPKVTARRFIVAGTIFLTGAIGFEMLSAKQAELFGLENLLYAIYYTCEELLEMLGIALFLHTLLTYVLAQFKTLTIVISDQPQ